MVAQAAQTHHVGGTLPPVPDRQARQSSGSGQDHHVRRGNGAGYSVSLAREQHSYTLDQQRRSSCFCIAAAVRVAPDAMPSRTSGAEGGAGKRIGSNPDTAPRSAPYIIGKPAVATLDRTMSRFGDPCAFDRARFADRG